MDDLQERIEELNGVVSVSKKEISEKREQLPGKLESGKDGRGNKDEPAIDWWV